MSKVKIQGNASGTGVLTVTAPNTSTDRTITLPDSTGTLLTADGDGSSLTGVGVAGISSSADATAITINSSEQVGIGKTPVNTLDVNHSGGAIVKLWRDSSSGYLQFDTDGTSAHIKNGGGSIKFKTGGDTVRASVTDNGICFGTDTAAANALDDYEEGTFTPNVGGDATYTNQNGSYTKVGRLVTVKINFQVNAINSSGKNIIYGLPFTSTSGAAHVGSVGYYSGLSVSPTWIGCYGDANNTQITFIWNTGNSLTIGANGQNLFQNSARIDLSLTYQTT